jgi:protein involved in polysaccharide export with SLBB domain
MKTTKVLIKFLLLIIAISQFSICALAFQQSPDTQRENSNPTIPSDSTSANDNSQNSQSNGPSLPAERIESIFRDNPEVLAPIERQISARVGTEVTDDEVYDRTRNDASFRNTVTRYLIANGYVSADDPELSTSFDSQSSDTSRPSNNIGTSNNVGNVDQGNRSDQTMRGSRPSEAAGRPGAARSTSSDSTNPEFKRSPTSSYPQRNRKSPYWDMPAMRDLYRQNSESTGQLRRFGNQIFQNDVTLSDRTSDLAASRDYVLGTGDGVTIELWGPISRHLTMTVDRDGRLFLPDAGAVTVSGKTIAEANDLIQAVLQKQFVNIRSDLSLTRIRTIRVYVVGDVVRPGAYDISALATILNVIGAAGGISDRGSFRHIRQLRANSLVGEIDLYDFLLNGVSSQTTRLQPGDTFLIPPVTSQVAISGMVRRPAIYELRDEQNLQQAINLAGGLMAAASLKDISVERIQTNSGRVMIPVNVPQTDFASAAALGSFKIQNGDQIRIGSIAPYSKDSVYLTGHVLNPGKFSYRQGMTVLDVIRSYGDLLPEPSDRAEVVRLSPPDFHPQVFDFHLADVLSGKTTVRLESFDTIRIYGRYEFDAPKVAIYGEVLRPGEYPLGQNMSAVDLVRMAGGFKRSAFTEQADLVSYTSRPDGQIDVERQSIKIGRAMGGVEDTDFRLKPGDVLTIRQVTGWNDIGSSVKIAGEVAHAGTFGIERGERLSSVLKRAGGFTSLAYTRGAVITRQQVREIDQKARDTMIQRVENSFPQYKGTNTGEAAALASAFQAQQQQILKRLREQPVIGRQIIHIGNDISKWENTPADIEMRAGDQIIIPKLPNFVAVEGQVNSPSAVTFTPGKQAKWYLARTGGVAGFGDFKKIFIVRADGSVVGSSGHSMFSGGVTSTVMQPGDTIVVPEKIISDNATLRNILSAAQVMSSIAIAAGVVASF